MGRIAPESDEGDQSSHKVNSTQPSFDFILSGRDDEKLSVNYWQAQAFANRIHREFLSSAKRGDSSGMASRFYALLDYYATSLDVFRKSFLEKNSAMIVSSLRSLLSLNAPLHDMYKTAPNVIPLPITVDSTLKKKVTYDLIIKTFQNPTQELEFKDFQDYLCSHTFLSQIRKKQINQYLSDLISNGHLVQKGEVYYRSKRVYKETNLDDASLQAFLGKDIYQIFERNGFTGITNIEHRKDAFHKFFEEQTGCGIIISNLMIATLSELLTSESKKPLHSTIYNSDLINSAIPRPYQRDAFQIFRGYGYQGVLIEAPTGSGKTLIGMMAIQDWLETMSAGETILVLVPTVNYEQQWVRELCYKDIGIKLSPDDVFAGSPSTYYNQLRTRGASPSLLIMTYTGLAQLGSPKGKGGFDQISVEKFLQGTNTRYVILDEVHKVVENMNSVSVQVTKVMIEWLKDGSLEGVIGFSGTADSYRERFDEIGLQLVYAMPTAELIAYGFVAPFTELGIPFTHSDREKKVLGLLDDYKELMKQYIGLLGPSHIKSMFFEIPVQNRISIARDILGMYDGRKDRNRLIRRRFSIWKKSDSISLDEVQLLTIIQIHYSLTDESLMMQIVSSQPIEERKILLSNYEKVIHRMKGIRRDLQELIFFSDIVSMLRRPQFSTYVDFEELRTLTSKELTKREHREEVRKILSTTVVGLFLVLRTIYYRMGEGLSESISSIIAAEQMARKLSGVIVFAKGKRITWELGTTSPGFSGVGGLFAQILGKRHLKPIAVLSSEMYLPFSNTNPVTKQIAELIREDIMKDELGSALFSICIQAVQLEEGERVELSELFNSLYAEFINTLLGMKAFRIKTFQESFLENLKARLAEVNVSNADKMLARLEMSNPHLKKWLRTLFDYALIAKRFSTPYIGELEQADGQIRKFFVVRMAGGDRKQLMYDLAARIVDSNRLPLNVIIVSGWARTGWNVITPNLLIDATSTRNVTAWQQLRGRTMRAQKTWNREAYELMMRLLGYSDVDDESESKLISKLESLEIQILLDVLEEKRKEIRNLDYTVENPPDLSNKLKKGDLSILTKEERLLLSVYLMEARNKVTHIYELIKAHGTNSQIRYNRRMNSWKRKNQIARKHSKSYCVNPFTGECSVGEDHAPLVYLEDPREHSPSQLKLHLARKMRQKDPIIIRGWIDAVSK